MNIFLINVVLLMNALLDGSIEKVKETSRSLRREGIARPSINHKIMVIGRSAPLIWNEVVKPAVVVRDWVRPSLADIESKNIQWSQGLRVKCENCLSQGIESWFPKDMKACRKCNHWPSYFSTLNAELRDKVNTTYEPMLEMLGIRLTEKKRGPRSYLDARFCILKAVLREGMLRNGSNPQVWKYTGITNGQVARMLRHLGFNDEAEIWGAKPANGQAWRDLVFFDYVHEADRTMIRTGCADVAFNDYINSLGIKTRTSLNVEV